MATREDDLIYFAQKVKKAQSPQAKLRALRQLIMMSKALETETSSHVKKGQV